MKVLCVGGGSGGHITPVSAIVAEIKKKDPSTDVYFITDKRFFGLAKEKMEPLGATVSRVSAGKFRRYANLKWYDHIKHIFVSYIPNVIDAFKFLAGLIQSIFKIAAFKPDVVFVKGGYVGLPVGLAAAFLKRPIVLHDSDATPGLTNRILGKYANKIGLGMPQDDSNFDSKKTEYVGIPVDEHYGEVSKQEKNMLREKYINGSDLPVILAMGGSQGSAVINQTMVESFSEFKGKADVFLVTGTDNYDSIKSAIDKNKRDYLGLRVLPFLSGNEVFDLIGLSDIVVTRAGVTTITELAAEKKATIIIPSPYLSSDHQSKNAELFKKAKAAVVVNQNNLKEEFVPQVNRLLASPSIRQDLGKNLHKFASVDAAKKMADIVIKVGKHEKA